MFVQQQKFDVNDVVTLKLITGEEVLGKYVSDDISGITLSKPLMIAMTQKGPAMAPILMTVDPDKNLTFAKSAIIISAPAYKEIADQYTYQTTGIQPVSAGSIIT
jgi:hypothetical protein